MRFSVNAAQTALTLNDGITGGLAIRQRGFFLKEVVILYFLMAVASHIGQVRLIDFTNVLLIPDAASGYKP